jgi:hypothetical protein
LLLALCLPAWPFAAEPAPPAPAGTSARPSLEALLREFERVEADAASLTPSAPEAAARLRDLVQSLARANAQLTREVIELRAALVALRVASVAAANPGSQSGAPGRAAATHPAAGSKPRPGAPLASPGAATAPAGPVRPAGAFFAKRGLKKFHRLGCHFGERVKEADRVYFASPAEAAAAGLEPCKVCRPGE